MSLESDPANTEAIRLQLKARCATAIGLDHEALGNADKTSQVLVEVLSHFPEQAELFIKTQNYAADKTGERQLHIDHVLTRRDENGGKDKYQDLNQGEWYSGRDIVEVVEEVDKIRNAVEVRKDAQAGKGGSFTDKTYYQRRDVVKRILQAWYKRKLRKDLGTSEKICHLTLDEIKFAEQEFNLICTYFNATGGLQLLHEQTAATISNAETAVKAAYDAIQTYRQS